MKHFDSKTRSSRILGSLILIFIVSLIQTQDAVVMSKDLSQSPWRKIKLEPFSFCLPADMVQQEGKGRDSAIWIYSSKKMNLNIDLGIYSARPLDSRAEPEYQEEHVRIDGKRAIMVFFRSGQANGKKHPYVAAVYFSNLGPWRTKLYFFATCASPEDQKIARKIFLSIDFGREFSKSNMRRQSRLRGD